MKISFHNRFGWKLELSDYTLTRLKKNIYINRIHFFVVSFNSHARLFYKFD